MILHCNKILSNIYYNSIWLLNWFIACKNGNQEIVKLLLKKSLKINGKENSGATALFQKLNVDNIKFNNLILLVIL